MCGIVGIADHFRREQLPLAVNAINAGATHHGPDDEGSLVGDNFAFTSIVGPIFS